MFYYYLLFQLINEINSFIETNYGDRNFIHITNKVADRPCRACDDGCVVARAALVVTCRDVTQQVEFWLMPCRIVHKCKTEFGYWPVTDI